MQGAKNYNNKNVTARELTIMCSCVMSKLIKASNSLLPRFIGPHLIFKVPWFFFVALWIPCWVLFTLPVTLPTSPHSGLPRHINGTAWGQVFNWAVLKGGDVLMRPGPVFILNFEALPCRCPSSNLKAMYGLAWLPKQRQASLNSSAVTFSSESNTPTVIFFLHYIKCTLFIYINITFNLKMSH